jgi:uncharacterized membrane protein YgcG
MTRLPIFLTLAGLLAVGAPAPTAAQAPADAVRFVGCWDPADGMPSRARICMAPEDGGMRVTNISAQGVTTQSSLRFDGDRVAVSSDDCAGWESARLSGDGERIVVKAELSCGTEPMRKRETTFSITASGHLMQATGSGLAIVSSAQIRVFAPVGSYADVPSETRDAVMPHLVAAERARLQQDEHPISARDLVELESLGVSTPLIDLMVAAAYPRSFVIDASMGTAAATATAARGGAAAGGSGAVGMPSPSMMYLNGYPMLSMYDWQLLYSCSQVSTFACNALPYYGYSAFGAGFGGRYATGYYGGYWPTMGYFPVVVRPAAPAAPNGGRAVRGRGYTETGNTSGGTATPRSSTTTSVRSGSSGGASSSGSGGSSSGGSSSGGSARTAKPRSPGT